MPPADVEFKDLLEQARQGDRDAVAELLRQYEPQLRVYARVHLGAALRRHADSLDLVQSAQKSMLIALWSNKYDFANPENLLALAKTILKRKLARLADRVRHQQPMPTDTQEAGPAHAARDEPLSREADPAHAAALQDTLELIRGQLTAAEQNMMFLVLQGCRQKEVAERLGYDPDAFRVYWSRLARRLRASGVLAGWFDE